MRVLPLFALAVCACAQAPDSDKPIDVAKMLADQMTPPNSAPERVVAVVDGVKVTAGELFRYYSAQPSTIQFYLAQDRKALVERYILSKRVAGMAAARKLDQKQPYKEQLESARSSVLFQAYLDDVNGKTTVTEAQQRKYYAEHLNDFSTAQVSGILILPNVPQGKEKAADLVRRLRAGEDFAALAKAHSGDPKSGAAGGRLGPVLKSSPLPDELKTPLFALKPREISEPIEYNGNYWILRIDEMQVKDYAGVETEIYKLLKQKALEDDLDAIRRKFVLKIEDPTYFQVTRPTSLAVPVPGAKQ